MNERWTTLPNAPSVLRHDHDARPAWLWSADGQRLLWANRAAELFLAKDKKHGLKLAAPAVPIKGQVARIIRLGSVGRSSLARIQFIAGDRPASATCTTTPLAWENGETALLIVAVDPIADDILRAAGEGSAPLAATMPEAPGEGAAPVSDSPQPVEDGPATDDGEIAADDHDYARELQSWQEADAETVYAAAEATPAIVPDTDAPQAWAEALGDAPLTPAGSVEGEAHPAAPDEQASPRFRSLSALVERLAADDALFTPLDAGDDVVPVARPAGPDDAQVTAFPQEAAPEPEYEQDAEPEHEPTLEAEPEPEPEPEDDGARGSVETVEAAPIRLYKVTGRGFVPRAADADQMETQETEPAPADAVIEAIAEIQPPADPESVERVSRYNFDELSRILSDRVGGKEAPEPPVPANAAAISGALVNLGGETLVLNRLPLGILVFRDQQVLFANRAITEMVGYESVDSLRRAGLGSIFPAMGAEGQEAGPVNHLVQQDGTLVPVTARLQSISWQGRPALMLSASTTEVRTGHEDAVRAFAETFADLRGEGFIETNRSGSVSGASASAVALLAGGKPMTGKALSALVGADDAVALRAFLERPARFAETARPALPLRSLDGKADILLFALGQAGVVSGYFGLVHARESAQVRIGNAGDLDPALLARISRGVRRPLNAIVGFSDLLRGKAFGELGNERYEGYAEDIARAGREIAALVDELDDYTRLRDGRYLPQRASLELTSLLESCVLRVREQANAARVIVRNAISETLPRVTADRASLAQAVLNLLASAIDQTPAGSVVVISAQRLDDGAIAIHVRDSSAHAVDMAERFVVFRDGLDKDGQYLAPVRSSVGLALTRSLLAVNAISLSVDPAGKEGLLFSLRIPADLVDERPALPQPEEK